MWHWLKIDKKLTGKVRPGSGFVNREKGVRSLKGFVI
jgi:hypothetical protein